MFCKMERYAYCLTRRSYNHHLYVYFSSLDVLTKHPHFTHTVEFVNHWALDIVFNTQIFNNHFSIGRNYLLFLKCATVFFSVVPKNYAKYFHLCMKFFKK